MFSISEFSLTAIISQVCIGVMLCSLSLTALAKQAESPQLNLYAVPLNQSFVGPQNSYQINLAMSDTATKNLVFGNEPNLSEVSEFKIETLSITDIRRDMSAESNHATLTPQFSLGSEGDQITIRPLQRTILIMWHKAFH